MHGTCKPVLIKSLAEDPTEASLLSSWISYSRCLQVLVWHLPALGAGAARSQSLLVEIPTPMPHAASAVPFGSVPLASVAWTGTAASTPTLVVGDATNSRLALLGFRHSATPLPTLQTLQLVGSGDAPFNHLAVLPEQGLVVLANTRGNAIYVVSLGANVAQPRFTHFSKFPVTTPILSLAARMVEQEDGESKPKAQLACTQTQVIPAGQLPSAAAHHAII